MKTPRGYAGRLSGASPRGNAGRLSGASPRGNAGRLSGASPRGSAGRLSGASPRGKATSRGKESPRREARLPGAGLRVGNGFDAHRLVAGRPLLLGGIEVPHGRGLEGHSDGDCVLHAVCDALLGAAGEGDMGRHFPSRDPQWRGVASRAFVEEVRRLVTAAGYVCVNLDVTIVAQEPVLSPHLEAMGAAIAGILGVAARQVSVKAKSTDHLGALGRGEGIAALATVLLCKGAVGRP